MDNEKLNDLKNKIDAYGRKAFAEALGVTYGVLSHKLGGFSCFSDEELLKAENILASGPGWKGSLIEGKNGPQN